MSTPRTDDDARTGPFRMPDAAPDERTRSVAREIEIEAPPDTVWRALTDARELARWFPLDAQVVPGPGGSVRVRWRDVHEVASRIDVWEPGRHLRTVGLTQLWDGIVTDYRIEGRGGGTILRVVSAGFGEGEDWNELLEGFAGGWDFELRGLKHYLERHRGTDRLVAWARAPYTLTREQAWTRLLGAAGWLVEHDLSGATAGSRWRGRTASGDALSGIVLLHHPPRQLVATVESMNAALLRLELQGGDGAGEVALWLSTYGVPAAEVRALERAWQDALDRTLGGTMCIPDSAAPRPRYRSSTEVAVHIPDLDRAEAFYAGVLGFRVVQRSDTMLELDSGALRLYVNADAFEPRAFIPSFDVTDARVAQRHLEAAGCRIVRGSADSGGFYVVDPFGLVLDVIERE